jgi:hypothetical protein
MIEGGVPQGRALRIMRRRIADDAGYSPVADASSSSRLLCSFE